MTDRTLQPPVGTGVNPLFSTAVFLWNGADPDKNAIGNVSSGSGLKGVNSSGNDGLYQYMNGTTGGITWAGITLPATTYTVVLVTVFPISSVSFSVLFSCVGGQGFRLEDQTTGGGVYHSWIHTGVAAAANTWVDSVGGFDTNKWVYIAAYDGTNLRQYRASAAAGSGQVTEVISYGAPAGNTIQIGDNSTAGQGLYAGIVIPSDVGDAECLNLLTNPWRMFQPLGAGYMSRANGPMSTRFGNAFACKYGRPRGF